MSRSRLSRPSRPASPALVLCVDFATGTVVDRYPADANRPASSGKLRATPISRLLADSKVMHPVFLDQTKESGKPFVDHAFTNLTTLCQAVLNAYGDVSVIMDSDYRVDRIIPLDKGVRNGR